MLFKNALSRFKTLNMDNTVFLTKDVRKLEKKLFTSRKEVDI